MNYEILENKLKQTLQQVPAVIDNSHLESTLSLARKEACLRQRRERISFAGFLIRQMTFMGWKVWTVQGIVLGILNAVLSRFYGYHISLQTMVKLLFCLSILVFMTVLPLLYRSVRYQMQEIEAATRFSCVKLLLARLFIISIGDVLLLCGIFLSTVLKTTLPAGSTILYLCFPFLLAGSGCLYMLRHFAPRHFFMGSLFFCFFLMLVFCIIPNQYMLLSLPSLTLVWIMICALLFAFCIWQFRHIVKDSSFTEAQLIV